MLHIITSTGDGLLIYINIDDLERPSTPKIKGFSNFFDIFAATHSLRVNCAKMAGDRPRNLHMKFFCVNRRF